MLLIFLDFRMMWLIVKRRTDAGIILRVIQNINK